MKYNCPKCGSNDVICVYSDKCECYNCHCSFNPKEIKYQQRLDKVLIKFENATLDTTSDNYVNINVWSGRDLLIFTNYDNEFILCYQSVNWVKELYSISLETVESLLKDLEANNDTK